MEKKKRMVGFDLARAYAIFGMYVVNYNVVFGNYNDTSWGSRFLSLFSGNASTVFVLLAGMGVALMTNRASYTLEERRKLRTTINKRALLLLGLGLLLFLWWPADILHFYAGYMHIAAFLLFVDKRYYLHAATFSVVIFHLLLIAIPYETGWNFETLAYQDFWTVPGFLRNTFYNGWNPVFPWFAYFTTGMYLGRLDWTLPETQWKMFLTGLGLFGTTWVFQTASQVAPINEAAKFYINADYLPPFLPFMISTAGFGLMLIAFFMYISNFLSENAFAKNVAKTGQMTLTHYISHLTIGMIFFTFITGKEFEGTMNDQLPVHPLVIFSFAVGYFIASYYFSKLWTRKFKNGPFELLMRKFSG